ncbi:MAG: hypothetical protein FJZ59_04455 [Chlamydiae bacterium]|jgi:hypothetical protein|nr:hypothetical protein [Chlamydiota bacterium]
MKDLNSLLSEKLQHKNQTKLQTLADKNLSQPHIGSFFKTTPLSEGETFALHKILFENKTPSSDLEHDLDSLKVLTQEIKAIQTQAIILHGERIKKAQALLKPYKDGAFTEWLLTVYGNRQTPYNFLQYYEFYLSLKEPIRPKLLDMPKQAVYTLASRSGDAEKKESIVTSYQGEPKHLILAKIRNTFPLGQTDRRKQKFSDHIILALTRLIEQLDQKEWSPSKVEKKKIESLLKAFIKKL